MASILSMLIWQDNLPALKDILQKKQQNHPDVDYIQSLDEWDHRGHPPLHLALMLGRIDAANALIGIH